MNNPIVRITAAYKLVDSARMVMNQTLRGFDLVGHIDITLNTLLFDWVDSKDEDRSQFVRRFIMMAAKVFKEGGIFDFKPLPKQVILETECDVRITLAHVGDEYTVIVDLGAQASLAGKYMLFEVLAKSGVNYTREELTEEPA